MKTRLVLFALLVVSAGSAFAASPAPTASAFGFPVTGVRHANRYEITRGTTQMTVLRLLGSPRSQLSPDVWIYAGYRPHVAEGKERGCDTLVVTFAEGRVGDLKIVNAAAVQIIAAQFRAPDASTRLTQR